MLVEDSLHLTYSTISFQLTFSFIVQVMQVLNNVMLSCPYYYLAFLNCTSLQVITYSLIIFVAPLLSAGKLYYDGDIIVNVNGNGDVPRYIGMEEA